jgi:hypothetical protein
LVKQKARIAKHEKVKLVDYPGKRTIVEWIMERERVISSIDPQLAALARELRAALRMRPGLMRVMPYTITVR